MNLGHADAARAAPSFTGAVAALAVGQVLCWDAASYAAGAAVDCGHGRGVITLCAMACALWAWAASP